ncbi:MAG: penicillin acylase family protein, partial [Alphaproteobacteria bacterium]
ATAQPPGTKPASAAASAGSGSDPKATAGTGDAAGNPFSRLRERRFGSNMYALGPDATRSGQPIVFGNPHFPWSGTERLYVTHLQIPGTIDIEGASLFGVPLVLIGFNDHVAWSHTVSTAYRFGLFQLKLEPGNPTRYLVDGEARDLDAVPLEIEVREDDGRTTTERQTLYRSEYGPMVQISVNGTPVMGWTNDTAYSLRDANRENTRLIEQFHRWNTATSLEEFERLHASILGTPWVNTVASGPDGLAYYGDVTVVPNVSDAKVKECTPPIGAVVATLVPGLPVLDGSRSACGWDTDPDAPAPGIFGPSHLPTLERRDWVANMNDSYWLTNPAQPLTGYARVIGDERTERSLRTRLGILHVQRRLDGSDGRGGNRFDLETLEDVVLSSQVYSGELARDAVLGTTCAGDGAAGLSAACDALARWDGTASLDAVGYPLWLEFWRRLPRIPWRTAFDANDPVNTPRDFDAAAPGIAEAFAGGAKAVTDAGFALDAPLRDVQHSCVNDPTIPIFGGPGGLGAFTVTYANGFGPEGYRVVDGNSYIQAVTWEGGRVRAEGFLTYSQSTDPANPHFADFTRAYSEKRWHRFPFTDEEIAAAKESEVRLVGR